MVAALAACSASHPPAAKTRPSLPPGAITADNWSPPALSGPPSRANFCLALTSIYRHMGDLPKAANTHVATQIIDDYVAFEPTMVQAAPPDVRPSAAAYLGAVAAYLSGLARAGLSLARLAPGSLNQLSSPQAQSAANQILGYSRSQCGYAIGGS